MASGAQASVVEIFTGAWSAEQARDPEIGSEGVETDAPADAIASIAQSARCEIPGLGAPAALKEKGSLQAPAAIGLALVFLTLLAGAGAINTGLGAPSPHVSEFLSKTDNVREVGLALYNPALPWLFPFEITSFLLLVGVVGAIILAKRRI